MAGMDEGFNQYMEFLNLICSAKLSQDKAYNVCEWFWSQSVWTE